MSARLLIRIDCDVEYSVRCPYCWGLDLHPRPSFFPCLFLARDNYSQRFIIHSEERTDSELLSKS